MEPVNQQLQDIFLWLIRSSLHGTILLAIILLVRAVVKGKFRFSMVYWLWMLLLLRLIWPLNVQTAFSVFNLIPQGGQPDRYLSTQSAEGPTVPISLSGDTLVSPSPISSDPAPATPCDLSASNESQIAPTRTLPPAVSAESPPYDWRQALCMVWLAGAVVMGAYVLFSNFHLWRIIKSQRLLTRQDILELLEDCKVQLGLQTVIGIVETEKIKTPCLFGYLRPRLLLPEGALDELTIEQLRYIFLHELAHLKRHDILIGWLMAAVQVLHWFNPAIWFAMSRINADRELACDELALSTLKEEESTEYGATILTFLERFARQQKLPAMAGIAENQSLLQRRMTMIAKFKNKKASFVPAIIIMLLLVATTFTSARTITKPDDENNARPVATASKRKPVPLAQDDGKSGGQESIAGGGHVVWFETEQEVELIGVQLFGSRYGTPQPPKEDFYIWIADENQEVLETFELPYAMFKRGNPKWYSMKTKATKFPRKFYLCVGFNPEKTKGVYVHHDAQASGNSYIGLPHDNFDFKPFDRGDWMIRPVVRPLSEVPEATTVSSSAAEDSLQAMIDAAEPGAVIEIPAGTYDQPIKVNKSLILRGTSQDECIIKVTANEPAIMLDTKGKGKVLIENMTIQWQLATSDKHEFPFAVAVKDTKAYIQKCSFRPLGNPERSPVAIRSMGFSEMNVKDCDFTGFDYVVCYGEGTKGTMADCFIRNCGHQGVILYSGAEVTIQRNIITGSQFHAVRSTGGKLDMLDNLIINNKNRGVYLGNKSCSGKIVNNLLIGNASGIDGMSACKFAVENNVILKSTYAAISARPYSMLAIQKNVLSDNPRGIIIHQDEGKSDPVKSKFGKNVFWNNQTDMENCESTDMIELEPDFIEPGSGNFKLADTAFEGMGLKDPKVIFDLWQRYKENAQ
jgi:beta-lactamase regulating signal transducer with metallopeptidase domain